MDVSDAIYHKKSMIPKKNYFQVVDQLMTAMVSLPPPMMMDRARAGNCVHTTRIVQPTRTQLDLPGRGHFIIFVQSQQLFIINQLFSFSIATPEGSTKNIQTNSILINPLRQVDLYFRSFLLLHPVSPSQLKRSFHSPLLLVIESNPLLRR